ncbi:MAG: hypothetical protein ACOVP8_07365 [Phycisphaerales bacterium]|jgi:hypothetical protein
MKWLSLIVDWFTALGEALMEEGLHGSRSGTWNMSESDSQKPIAWAVIEHGDPWPLALFTSRHDAELHASRKNDIGQRNCDAVPLHCSPAISGAEREAVMFCVSCAMDYRDTLDPCDHPERHDRATQMIQAAMRLAVPNVGPAPVEGQRTASVTDLGGAGPTID